MKKILMYHNIDNAVTFNRLFLPKQYLKDFDITLSPTLPYKGGDYDIIWVHGVFDKLMIVEVMHWLLRGKKVVWGIDDDYLSIPAWSSASLTDGLVEFHEIMTSIANHVVVSTSHLASKFKRQNVHVCPNLISKSLFNGVKPYREGDKFKILWQGSNTHQNDIKSLDYVIDTTLSTVDNCEFYMWGMCPSPQVYSKWLGKGLKILPTCHIFEYHEKLVELSPQIVLAPLHPCEFNLSKSNLRILEAWGVGAIPIVTNFGEYLKTIEGSYKLDENYTCFPAGVLENSPAEIVSNIRSFIECPSWREGCLSSSQEHVSKWYWENDTIWKDALSKIVS